MRHGQPCSITAAITLVIFAASCATTKLPPISSSAEAFQPEKDEVRLWAAAREEERRMLEKVTVHDDPLLLDYLEEVVGRLDTPGMAANIHIDYRVTVFPEPTLNAFAFPHGSLYIHTGLLARMENEDQLATVLAHEMTHVENRHMVRHQRSARNKRIGFSIASVAAAVVVAGEAGEAARAGRYGKAARIGILSDILLGLGLTLAFMAAVNGYGRKLEAEADHGGFTKMSLAGYDIRESPLVYAALKDDHGESGKFEAFFFGNHPRLSERIEAAEQWAAENPDAIHPSQFDDQAAFRRRMRPIIREDARMNIEIGRYNLAESELTRVLDEMPDDPMGLYLMGMVKAKKANNIKNKTEKAEMRDAARTFFQKASRRDPALPGPHRELGLLAYRAEDFQVACSEFNRYLELIDHAEKKAEPIRDYLLELEQDGHCS
jgi:predicted Zn-dependent protease